MVSTITSAYKLPDRNLKISDWDIPWKDNVKYLGLFLDKRLTFRKHIEEKVISGSKLIKILYSFINKNSKLNLKNKLLLYKTVIRPTILYSSKIWANCSNVHINKKQVFQNKVLKRVLNLPPWHSTIDIHRITGDLNEIGQIVKDVFSNLSKCS